MSFKYIREISTPQEILASMPLSPDLATDSRKNGTRRSRPSLPGKAISSCSSSVPVRPMMRMRSVIIFPGWPGCRRGQRQDHHHPQNLHQQAPHQWDGIQRYGPSAGSATGTKYCGGYPGHPENAHPSPTGIRPAGRRRNALSGKLSLSGRCLELCGRRCPIRGKSGPSPDLQRS